MGEALVAITTIATAVCSDTGLSQSGTEQLKNLDTMARGMLLHETWKKYKALTPSSSK